MEEAGPKLGETTEKYELQNGEKAPA